MLPIPQGIIVPCQSWCNLAYRADRAVELRLHGLGRFLDHSHLKRRWCSSPLESEGGHGMMERRREL